SYCNHISGNVPLSRIDRLAREYLTGEPVEPNSDLGQKAKELYERYSALLKAIEPTERELREIQAALSVSTAEDHKDEVRLYARDVLRGLLLMKRGYDAIEKLRFTRRQLGYQETIQNFGAYAPVVKG